MHISYLCKDIGLFTYLQIIFLKIRIISCKIFKCCQKISDSFHVVTVLFYIYNNFYCLIEIDLKIANKNLVNLKGEFLKF